MSLRQTQQRNQEPRARRGTTEKQGRITPGPSTWKLDVDPEDLDSPSEERRRGGCRLGDVFWNGAAGFWNLWGILGTSQTFLQQVRVPFALASLREVAGSGRRVLKDSGGKTWSATVLRKYLLAELRSRVCRVQDSGFQSLRPQPRLCSQCERLFYWSWCFRAPCCIRSDKPICAPPARPPCRSEALRCLPRVLSSVNGQCVTMSPFRTTAILGHC